MRLRGVSKTFGRHTVLAGIDLDVEPGTCLALMGPNGAGKTTLLRLMAGLLRPTRGTVERPRTAIVLQDAPLYPDLSPREHLRWWTRLHGMPAAPDAVLVDAGLETVLDAPVATLSRGQRQRLGITLALHAGADVLLLDEPYTALDIEGQAWLTDALQGKTAVVALHDPKHAEALDARVHLLEAA